MPSRVIGVQTLSPSLALSSPHVTKTIDWVRGTFFVALELARYASLIEDLAPDFDHVGFCRITASGALYCASWGEK